MRWIIVAREYGYGIIDTQNGNALLKARFHRYSQAQEHVLRLVVKRVLRLVQPEVFWADYPGRASAWRHNCSDYAGENERAIARSYAVVL